MVTLPSAINLGARDIPQSNRNIASFDGGAVGRAMQGAGQDLQQFGAKAQAKVDEGQDEQDRFEAAQAALMLDEYMINKQDELAKTPENYAKFESDFNTGFDQVLSQASGYIKNPRKQEMFKEIIAKEKRMRGVSQVRDLGLSFEKSSQGAYIDRSKQIASQILMTNPTDENYRARLVALDNYINGSKLLPEQKENQKQSIRKELTAVMFEGLSPKEQNARLKSITTSTDKAGSPLSVRNNNPGNLRGKDGEFRKFDTPEEGVKAMESDLLAKVSGNSPAMEHNYGKGYTPTIRTVISTYAPSTENDTEAYIRNVAKDSGIAPDAPLTKDDIAKIMPAMVKVEGGSASMAYFQDTFLPDYDVGVLMNVKNRLKATAPYLVNEQLQENVARAAAGQPFEPVDPDIMLMAEETKPGISEVYNSKMKIAQETYNALGYTQEQMRQTFKSVEPDVNSTIPYATQVETQKGVAEAINAAAKMQREDTASVAIMVNPTVKTLAEIAMESPDNFQAYADEVSKEAVKWKVQSPALLTKEMAADIAQKLGSESANREARLAELVDLKSKTGGYFAQVIDQVAPKLGNEVLTAAAFMEANPNDTALPTTIMNNFDKPDEEIEKMAPVGSVYPKANVKAITESPEYQRAMSDFNAALRQVDPSDQSKVDEMNRQIVRSGILYAKTGGMGLDAGIAKAIEQAQAGFKYISQGGKMYDGAGAPPIPVPLGIDADKISQFADSMVDSIAASGKLKYKFTSMDGLGERSYVDISDSVRDNAFWVRDPSGKGLRLVMPVATGNTDVLYGDTNEPVIKKWEEFSFIPATKQDQAKYQDYLQKGLKEAESWQGD